MITRLSLTPVINVMTYKIVDKVVPAYRWSFLKAQDLMFIIISECFSFYTPMCSNVCQLKQALDYISRFSAEI